MIMDSLLQECEEMVSGRLSFNLGDDDPDLGALDCLTPHQGVLWGRFDQDAGERSGRGMLG
jgi:hypothetical protein